MKWIHQFQLFLFDFDGLLVNTEEVHYLAYCCVCERRGFKFTMDFPSYCKIAHYDSRGLREKIYAMHPPLMEIEPNWEVLYAEKKQAFIDLVHDGKAKMMPGAETFLRLLAQANLNHAVVTHSAKELVAAVRQHNPVLNSIPHWMTREEYTLPKPDPECYQKAIEKLAGKNDHVIGFEDTPRGLNALLGTRATAVLICTAPYPEIPQFLARGVHHYNSFNELVTSIDILHN